MLQHVSPHEIFNNLLTSSNCATSSASICPILTGPFLPSVPLQPPLPSIFFFGLLLFFGHSCHFWKLLWCVNLNWACSRYQTVAGCVHLVSSATEFVPFALIRRSERGLWAARSTVCPPRTLTDPAEMSFYHVYGIRIERQSPRWLCRGNFIISSSLWCFQASLSRLAEVNMCESHIRGSCACCYVFIRDHTRRQCQGSTKPLWIKTGDVCEIHLTTYVKAAQNGEMAFKGV